MLYIPLLYINFLYMERSIHDISCVRKSRITERELVCRTKVDVHSSLEQDCHSNLRTCLSLTFYGTVLPFDEIALNSE